MISAFRFSPQIALAVLSAALLFSPSRARAAADGGTPCGNFDFANGATCRIEVSGSCQADCSPFSFEAGCSGGCSGSAETTCVDSCGEQCVATCNPASLDCFAGCHAECDEPTIALCRQKHPAEDCAATGKAQCDMHCKESCRIQPNDCSEHCTRCCRGSCTTQVNFDCDFSCFAELRGGCAVQCDRPEGAIFCNGQYVHASDVQACIVHLATRGIQVDTSAQGSIRCNLGGCEDGASGSGCAVSPSSLGGGAGLGAALFAVAGAIARLRRRGVSRSGPRGR